MCNGIPAPIPVWDPGAGTRGISRAPRSGSTGGTGAGPYRERRGFTGGCGFTGEGRRERSRAERSGAAVAAAAETGRGTGT